MTNKDTERLVRQAMQQTIPDKEALWAKIESDLPAQPAFGSIRRTQSKMRVVYRVMGAAACFLLIVGGIGIMGTIGGHKMDMTQNATMTADAPRNDEAPAAMAPEADDAAGEAEAENCAPACEDGVSDHREFSAVAGKSNEYKNAVQPQNDISAAPANEAPADDAACEAPADCVTLSGIIFGDAGAVQADAALLDETQGILDAGNSLMLQEEPLTERARADGILLGYELNGQEILLAAYDGRYQMIADGRAYCIPETSRALLDELTKGH
ncbi:MAG: hypothetical protein IJ906_06675 [Oscillospiraceae bacterium]|nr:hypothetical protein [Oscillospiraceae bacterium]